VTSAADSGTQSRMVGRVIRYGMAKKSTSRPAVENTSVVPTARMVVRMRAAVRRLYASLSCAITSHIATAITVPERGM